MSSKTCLSRLICTTFAIRQTEPDITNRELVTLQHAQIHILECGEETKLEQDEYGLQSCSLMRKVRKIDPATTCHDETKPYSFDIRRSILNCVKDIRSIPC